MERYKKASFFSHRYTQSPTDIGMLWGRKVDALTRYCSQQIFNQKLWGVRTVDLKFSFYSYFLTERLLFWIMQTGRRTKKLDLTQLFCLSNKIYFLNWMRELLNSLLLLQALPSTLYLLAWPFCYNRSNCSYFNYTVSLSNNNNFLKILYHWNYLNWVQGQTFNLFRSPLKSMEISLLTWIGFQQDFSSFCIVYLTEVFPNVVFPFQSYLCCLIDFYHVE